MTTPRQTRRAVRAFGLAASLSVLPVVGGQAQGAPVAPAAASAQPMGTLAAFRSSTALRRYLLSLRTPPEDRALPRPPLCDARDSAAAADRSLWAGLRRARTAVVTGRVRAESGAPIEGAAVSLACERVHARTDDAGGFRLVVPAFRGGGRRLHVWARAIGYGMVRDSVELSPGDSSHREITMRQAAMGLSQVVVTATRGSDAAESITNTQHAGVDEGGIVKQHGDHLVILRRGRLFTVRVGDDTLRAVATVDAFPPDPERRGGWYDELLIHGDRAVVVGYSYARDATEINLFRLDSAGTIRYEETHLLRSDDYYSSRNYASRVVEGRLVVYTPLWLGDDGDPLAQLPAHRRWRSPEDATPFTPLADPTRVHHVPGLLARGDPVAMHAVTSCDLRGDPFRCESRVVIGPPAEVVYVSPRAVHLSMAPYRRRDAASPRLTLLARVPLDGTAPSGTSIEGSPIDQFSFREDDVGTLHVLLDKGANGAWMWNAERRATSRALLLARVPLDAYGNGRRPLPSGAYRVLPDPGDGDLHNRFVGEHLLYGTGAGWWNGPDRAPDRTLVVVHLEGGVPAIFRMPFDIGRLEVMGRDAVVIGEDERDLHFTTVRLGATVRLGHRYVRRNASEAESRSHGFFYRPTGERTGIIGLPVAAAERDTWQQLFSGAAGVIFLRNDGEAFHEAGALHASPGEPPEDDCIASCVDWYGNARPIFLRGRAYALLGYELVEGSLGDVGVTEVRRVGFAPSRRGAAGR